MKNACIALAENLLSRARYDTLEYPRNRAWRRTFPRRDAMDILNDEVAGYNANEREKARKEQERARETEEVRRTLEE